MGVVRSALKASPTRKAGAIRTEHIDPIPTQLATNKLSRGRGRRRGRERCVSRAATDGVWPRLGVLIRLCARTSVPARATCCSDDPLSDATFRACLRMRLTLGYGL